MLWRILTSVVVLFWAIMTGLLLRDTYFPAESRFADVPPKYVFELFLREAATFNNTLLLYHEKEQLGRADVHIRKVDGNPEAPVYEVVANGSVQPSDKPGKITNWTFAGELVSGTRWRSLKVRMTMPEHWTADVTWKEGQAIPQVEVKQRNEMVLDSQMLQMMMAVQGGGGAGNQLSWLAQAGHATSAGEIGGMQLKAREGVMELAGKQRKCFIVSLQLLNTYEIAAYFTEVGELARIDLPEGYQLLEPLMHGLEPGLSNRP